LFAQQTRSAEGLENILADYFEAPVRVREFAGAWVAIPRELRLAFGRDSDSATLGEGAFLGRATWQCQHKFEMVFGPLTLARLESFLPGQRGLSELQAMVRLYTNDEWVWQLRLLLLPAEIPRIRLGRAGRLGWTTWLGTRRAVADDVVIQGH
jgi:type VI secretion system protein ImpH